MEQEKPKEMLIIEPPNELRFRGPFNRAVVTMMKLTNPTDNTILFKIKTTAPKRYCVRPNFGIVNPKNYSMVEICLQPFVYEANEKNKHKFMVQSLVAPADATNYNDVWKEVEPDQLMDAKLKCVFDMPDAPSTTEYVGQDSGEKLSKEAATKTESSINASSALPTEPSDSIYVEVRLLREENCNLRKENINLKEQVVRLRCSPSKPPMDEPYTPMIMAEKQIPMFYIAIAIAAVIFGVLLGKYML